MKRGHCSAGESVCSSFGERSQVEHVFEEAMAKRMRFGILAPRSPRGAHTDDDKTIVFPVKQTPR